MLARVTKTVIPLPKMRNRIRQLRQARGLTLEALAQLVGTTPSQISRLEIGERRLTDDWMSRVSKALKVDWIDLIHRPKAATDPDHVAKDELEFLVLRWWRLLSREERVWVTQLIRSQMTTTLAHKVAAADRAKRNNRAATSN